VEQAIVSQWPVFLALRRTFPCSAFPDHLPEPRKSRISILDHNPLRMLHHEHLTLPFLPLQLQAKLVPHSV
jgi:hypothetical protein